MPSLSVALAVMVMFAGAARLALLAGELMLTAGATFDDVNDTLIAEDVVTPPILSVALAVST